MLATNWIDKLRNKKVYYSRKTFRNIVGFANVPSHNEPIQYIAVLFVCVEYRYGG